MKQLIQAMVAQILAINSRMAITYENGLLTVGSGLSICVTDNEVEQRAVLAGVLLGLTAPQIQLGGWDDGQDIDNDDDDEDADSQTLRLMEGNYPGAPYNEAPEEVEDMNEEGAILFVLTR